MSVEDFAVAAANRGGGAYWQPPLDIIGAPELVGWPELSAECLPAPLYHYVMAEAERLGAEILARSPPTS